jgi:signal peptidase I
MDPNNPSTMYTSDPNTTTPNYGSEEQNVWAKIKDNIAELIEFVAIVGVVVLIIQFFIAKPHQVSGSSMVPNFHNGDYIITNLLATKFAALQRGEVIVFKNPRNTNQVFIKRIIGITGDKVRISNGRVYLNGQLLEEPYLPAGTPTNSRGFMADDEEVTVPQDNYFVLGDNREGSSDSREWGFLSKDLVIGQAFLRYWPINKAELIKIDASSQ